MAQVGFLKDVVLDYEVLDQESVKIIEFECQKLKVAPEFFLMACRAISRQSLTTLNMLMKTGAYITKDEVKKYFNIDILQEEIYNLKKKSISYELPTLPEKGDLLDKYQILATLGQGATSVVYKAMNIFIKAEVALKILKPIVIFEDAYIQDKFLNEAINVARLFHPGAVKVIDAEKRGKYTYMVMEYVDGLTLEQVLENNSTIKPNLVVKIAIQLCKALDYAQRMGIIHRDIKPANIMLSKEGNVKLTDFGLAKLVNEPDQYQTISGKIYGTPYYMSPETFLSPDNVDIRSDMYSLGATLYHLLTGAVPFETNSIPKIIYMHAYQQPIPPAKINHDISTSFSNIIMKMLEKDPANRYESYLELYKDLKNIMNSEYREVNIFDTFQLR
jgi:serine/threonine protein kinase